MVDLRNMKKKIKILLTGASGFAGSHMLKHLYATTGHSITCPFTYTHGGHPERITSIIGDIDKTRVQLIKTDLADKQFLSIMAKSDFDVIINFASESHVDRSILNPHEFMSNNTNLMINLLEYARKLSKLKLFLHISTDEVFGSLKNSITNQEWERPHFPSNPYSASKAAQEALVISYHKTFNLPIAIANITNMIGEAQNQEKYLPKVIRKIYHGESIQVDTTMSGEIGSRKYIHVEDVALAVSRIMELELGGFKDKNYQDLPSKYHISGSMELTNLEIVEKVSQVMNKKAKINFAPSPRIGYDQQYQLSSKKLRDLGWEEKFPIQTRIEQVVNWTLRNQKWLEIDHDSGGFN
jgi:dTDP-glucose 4,6-dehydratase